MLPVFMTNRAMPQCPTLPLNAFHKFAILTVVAPARNTKSAENAKLQEIARFH